MVSRVSDLLHPGENVVAFEVADGWFAGRVGMLGSSAEFGHRLRVRWQLSVDSDSGDRRIFGSGADDHVFFLLHPDHRAASRPDLRRFQRDGRRSL